MNHYLKQAAVVGVLSTILVGVQLFAFTEPTLPPPAGNLPAPVTTGGVGQVKPGDLTISKPDNSALFTTDKLVTIGGAILNTGGALNGLIVDKGNVGIGTANPQAKLDVFGNTKVVGDITEIGNVTQTGNLAVTGNTTVSSGRVGIGTTVPLQPLDVVGKIKTSDAYMVGGDVGINTSFSWSYCSGGLSYTNTITFKGGIVVKFEQVAGGYIPPCTPAQTGNDGTGSL